MDSVDSELYGNVRSIIAKARATVYVTANAAMVDAYWNVGREIVEKQGGKSKAKYGDGLIRRLAVQLTTSLERAILLGICLICASSISHFQNSCL